MASSVDRLNHAHARCQIYQPPAHVNTLVDEVVAVARAVSLRSIPFRTGSEWGDRYNDLLAARNDLEMAVREM